MNRQQERSRWRGMLRRCENPASPDYCWYGGRGIKVCERWHDFENYYADIMRLIGPCPDPRMSLDRINNDGGYEPGNVRWASPWRQVKNSRVYGRPKNPSLYTSSSPHACPHCHHGFLDLAAHLARKHSDVIVPGKGTFVKRQEG